MRTVTDQDVQAAEAYLELAHKRLDSTIPPAVQRLREAAQASVDGALSLARAGRKAQSGSSSAVHPGVPPKPGELTARFQALRPG